MDKRGETDREFGRAVRLADGATAIPRWTLDPEPGVAEHAAALDDDLPAALRRLADGPALPLHSVWPRTRRCNRAVSLDDIAEHPVRTDLTELPHREHAPNC